MSKEPKNAAAVALGRKGGSKRWQNVSPEDRKAIMQRLTALSPRTKKRKGLDT